MPLLTARLKNAEIAMRIVIEEWKLRIGAPNSLAVSGGMTEIRRLEMSPASCRCRGGIAKIDGLKKTPQARRRAIDRQGEPAESEDSRGAISRVM